MGAGVNPGMALTPFPSNNGQDLTNILLVDVLYSTFKISQLFLLVT